MKTLGRYLLPLVFSLAFVRAPMASVYGAVAKICSDFATHQETQASFETNGASTFSNRIIEGLEGQCMLAQLPS